MEPRLPWTNISEVSPAVKFFVEQDTEVIHTQVGDNLESSISTRKFQIRSDIWGHMDNTSQSLTITVDCVRAEIKSKETGVEVGGAKLA